MYTQSSVSYTHLLHEGYGLNKKAIDTIKERNIDLIITVDCGISAIEEVDYAVRLGMDIIVTDPVSYTHLKRTSNDNSSLQRK